MDFTAPTADQMLAIRVNAGIDELAVQTERFAHASPDLVEAIVEGSASSPPANSRRSTARATRKGAAGKRRRAPAGGFAAAYRAYVEQGWNAIASDREAFGGQGLPFTLACNVLENLGAANMAFTLLPMLTVGAIEALEHHGSPRSRRCICPSWSAANGRAR
jgi:3-(methylthio)propanoyl-CoA dehydrogenase